RSRFLPTPRRDSSLLSSLLGDAGARWEQSCATHPRTSGVVEPFRCRLRRGPSTLRLMLGFLRTVALTGVFAVASGGPSSRLITVRARTGSGAVTFEVKNNTDVPINELYMADSEAVSAAERVDPNSPEGHARWGTDRLTAAIPTGERVELPVEKPGNYDVRALDRDRREQHVARLRLQAGGRYILELNEGGWRVR